MCLFEVNFVFPAGTVMAKFMSRIYTTPGIIDHDIGYRVFYSVGNNLQSSPAMTYRHTVEASLYHI